MLDHQHRQTALDHFLDVVSNHVYFSLHQTMGNDFYLYYNVRRTKPIRFIYYTEKMCIVRSALLQITFIKYCFVYVLRYKNSQHGLILDNSNRNFYRKFNNSVFCLILW